MTTAFEVFAGGLLILLSGFLSMAAGGFGIVRFPDVLTRLHAATKPQVLGLATVLLAIFVRNPTWGGSRRRPCSS